MENQHYSHPATTIPLTPRQQLSKKKLKVPLSLKIIQWAYPKLEQFAPRYAHPWFVRLFFTPVRYKIPAQEKALLKDAEMLTLSVKGRKVIGYSWGKKGPVILLVHGWAGRAGQFRNFIQPLSSRGFRVVAFDAPGHGSSEGRETSIIEFKDAILEIEKSVGKVEAIIAHSLGGAASLFALAEGLPVHTLVTIATPTIGEEIINEFTTRLNGTDHSRNFLLKSFEEKLKRPFESFMATYFIKQLDQEINMLIIHDEQDKEASFRNAETLLASYPKAKFIRTRGLGHVRILRDEAVIRQCLDFIQKKE